MKRSLFIFAGLIVLSTTVWAQSRLSEAIFHRYDKNKDGIVSASELPDPATRARFDKNGDGEVTLEEFRETLRGEEKREAEASVTSKLDAVVSTLDTNGDGQISREEAKGARWFDRLDQDGDGVISKEELARVRQFVSLLGSGRAPAAESETRSISREEIARVTSGPEIRNPNEAGIGRMISDAVFTDIDGTEHRLGDVANHRGLVIAMTSATCPVSKRYLPTLAKLKPELAAQNIPLILVNPFRSEEENKIREQIATFEEQIPYVHDKDKELCAVLQAETTTEVFLIDSKRTLIYRGALDDQYGIDYSVQEPRHHYLTDAVKALIEGVSPEIAATAAPGCELELPGTAPSEKGTTDVTYHRDVARILQQNCVQCHRDGGIAPFGLEDYEEVTDRARVIRRVVSEGTMPPWFAAPPKNGEPSPWLNDHSLSVRDQADLLAWLESPDKPVGDPAEAPAPRKYQGEWSIGEPDMIVPLSRSYKIKATGFMPYQHDIVETELTEDKWVSAYEILPSERDVVHHVIVQVFEKGSTIRQLGEGIGGYWAAYVPGNGAHVWPEGFARKLPAGARIAFQIHYTPSGKEKSERLRMGLKFAKEPPQYQVKTLSVVDRSLNIPPGASAHREGASRKLNFDLPVTSFMAHMHTRGAAFTYEVTYPDGKTETLLDIPRYDFNWQLRYDLKTPKYLPRGSVVKVIGVFDNSTNNRANPDPTQTVRWGPQTVDEMLIGYIEYFAPVGVSSFDEED